MQVKAKPAVDHRPKHEREFFRPGAPIPAEHQVIALCTLVKYDGGDAHGGFGREIKEGDVVDDRDPIVRENPQWFRRWGPTLDREVASGG